MSNKFDGDVRPLSNDQRYMGVVFEGFLGGGEHVDNALVQARAAKDYGLAAQPGRAPRISRDRWNLLEHLGLTRHYAEEALLDRAYVDTHEDWSVEYGIARIEPKRAPSPYSLEHAMQRWPQNFLATDMPADLPLNWGLPS